MEIMWVVIVFVCIIFSMVIHEVSHGLVGYLLGDTTARDRGRLTLNPFKHIDPITTVLVPVLLYLAGGPIFGGAKPVPLDQNKIKYGDAGVALVAIAGPISNFILAFVGFGVWVFTKDNLLFISQIANIFVNVNLGFMLFNLIPVPPLDGSRVLFAFAPDFIKDIMRRAEPYGFIIIMIMVIVFSTTLTSVILGAQNLIIDLFMEIFRV